ncbi:hypothetical protein GCM10010172_62350 [Paractinoplanes ferrugineus]|uniref:Uncharacterized protein n=1 Tax=Paractinoplanes ferrugineus TaxID=113564 RepID=A0A919JBH8_9ACTN|nr:hypothetical protein Afe05nite_84430 [Actinoplanes ferrugineus]
MTAGTVGLGGAFRMAQYGKLGGIKGAPVPPMQWVTRSGRDFMKTVQTDAWNEMGMWS